MKRYMTTALVVSMVVFGAAGAEAAAKKKTNYSYPQQTYTPPVAQYGVKQTTSTSSASLKGQVVFVPSGTSIPALVTSEISTAALTAGQPMSFALGKNYYYGNKLIAPAGSSVNGYVTVLKKAGRAGQNAQLMVRFQSLTTTNGQMIPLNGVLKTDDGTGLLKGGTAMDTTKDYAKDIAVGAGAGALTGLVAGAIADGNKGKSTAIMTGVGAGAGLAKSLWDKGGEITIPANSQVDIVLQQPMTVNTY